MSRKEHRLHAFMDELGLEKRRSFLRSGGLTLATLLISPFFGRTTFGAAHRYKLAPESILPRDIREAPVDVREAYRFALANRNTLRYIPCYGRVAASRDTRATLLAILRTIRHPINRYSIA